MLTDNTVQQVSEGGTETVDTRETRCVTVWNLTGGGTETTYGSRGLTGIAHPSTLSVLPDPAPAPSAPWTSGNSSSELRGSLTTTVQTDPTYRRCYEYDDGALVVYGATVTSNNPPAPSTPVAVRTEEATGIAYDSTAVEMRTLAQPVETDIDYAI